MTALLKTWNWEEPYFTTEEIKEANEAIKSGYTEKQSFTKGAMKNDKPLRNIEPEAAFVANTSRKTQEAIHQAIRTCQYEFGYSLFAPNMFDTILYNVYSSDIQGHYGLHQDKARSDMYDIKMTLLINLSEQEYEGGNLVIEDETQEFMRKPGSMILFKSGMFHKVTPVTKGERISLAYFLIGPRSI